MAYIPDNSEVVYYNWKNTEGSQIETELVTDSYRVDLAKHYFNVIFVFFFKKSKHLSSAR